MHKEIENLKKNETLLREDLQAKDLEIGRLIQKTTELRLHTATYRIILNFYDLHLTPKIMLL